MAKSDALRMRELRARDKKKVADIVNRLIDDVTIKEEVRDGKRYLNCYSSDATWEALEAVAAIKGTTMDGMLKAVIASHIKLVAKWQLLKDRREALRRHED